MQNPNSKLEQGEWYHVASKVVLRQTKSAYSKGMMKIEPDELVMFIEYHSGSVRVCKVMYQEFIGWIMVDKKYKDHLHFFKRARLS